MADGTNVTVTALSGGWHPVRGRRVLLMIRTGVGLARRDCGPGDAGAGSRRRRKRSARLGAGDGRWCRPCTAGADRRTGAQVLKLCRQAIPRPGDRTGLRPPQHVDIHGGPRAAPFRILQPLPVAGQPSAGHAVQHPKRPARNKVFDLVTRRNVENGWATQRLPGQNVLVFEIGRNDWPASATAAKHYANVMAYLNTPVTGIAAARLFGAGHGQRRVVLNADANGHGAPGGATRSSSPIRRAS